MTLSGRLIVVAAVMVLGLSSVAAAEFNTAIRSFRVNIPDAELAELRRRVLATRWPDKETVADQSQGIQLARLQELVRHWGAAYDWRKVAWEQPQLFAEEIRAAFRSLR